MTKKFEDKKADHKPYLPGFYFIYIIVRPWQVLLKVKHTPQYIKIIKLRLIQTQHIDIIQLILFISRLYKLSQ